jgi:hypothetical protein
MNTKDDFSEYYQELLDGQYDCVDRIVLNAYFGFAQSPGGFRMWWRNLFGSDEKLDQAHMARMAGDFVRRVRGYAKKHQVPMINVPAGERKDDYWEHYRPKEAGFKGVFLILIGRAPGPVWSVDRYKGRIMKLYRPKKWPYVNHVYFHIMDPDWGHMIVRMCMYPPFGSQIILNGHEWVECQARKQGVPINKTGNCFVEGTDFRALEHVAKAVRKASVIGQLIRACDRWVYSSCLCFGLSQTEQARTGFRYQYSVFQLENSRNLLFTRGRLMEEVFQKMIDRTRRQIDVKRLKSIFGFQHRPYAKTKRGKEAAPPQMTIERPAYNLTIYKLRWGNLTLKIYDKGGRVLRIEVVAHNVKSLRCGTGMDKWDILLERMTQMLVNFLNTLQAAHVAFLDNETLDALPQPSLQGTRRLAGVDLNRPRIRLAAEALLAMATKPNGFTSSDMLEYMRQRQIPRLQYGQRHLVYDLAKFVAKRLVTHKPRSRYYHIEPKAMRTLSAYLIIREQVLKPVLAGVCHPKIGRPPKNVAPIDQHYMTLIQQLNATLIDLGIAA